MTRTEGKRHQKRISGTFKRGNYRSTVSRDVSDTIERGGTILQTARCAEMRTEEGQQESSKLSAKNMVLMVW